MPESAAMKTRFLLLLLLAGAWWARAQDDVSLPDLVQGAKQWAQENLDTNVLNALPDLDREKTDKLLHDLQQEFHGEYIIDLAARRRPAEAIVPILESHPETQPYAAWLKPRLDYLQVADELKVTIPPPEKGNTNVANPTPASNPSPEAERTAWDKKIAGQAAAPVDAHTLSRLKFAFWSRKVPPALVWIAEV